MRPPPTILTSDRVPHLRDSTIVAKVGEAPILHPDIHEAVILSEARSAESKNRRISLFTPSPVSPEATR